MTQLDRLISPIKRRHAPIRVRWACELLLLEERATRMLTVESFVQVLPEDRQVAPAQSTSCV